MGNSLAAAASAHRAAGRAGDVLRDWWHARRIDHARHDEHQPAAPRRPVDRRAAGAAARRRPLRRRPRVRRERRDRRSSSPPASRRRGPTWRCWASRSIPSGCASRGSSSPAPARATATSRPTCPSRSASAASRCRRPAGRRPAVIRAFNVLRQYDEAEVAGAWRSMSARLAPGGLVVEGTCDELGRVSSWVGVTASGPRTFTISLRRSGLEAPSIVAERLPKALIHRNVPGERIHELLATLDLAWRVARADVGLRRGRSAGSPPSPRCGTRGGPSSAGRAARASASSRCPGTPSRRADRAASSGCRVARPARGPVADPSVRWPGPSVRGQQRPRRVEVEPGRR